jgi:hypothetical protein
MSKLIVQFPPQMADVINDLAHREHRHNMNVIKLAIGTYKQLQDLTSEGYEIYAIHDGNKTKTKIIMP